MDSRESLIALRDRFWIEFREPGCVPDRKGPWPSSMTRAVLRECMAARPEAFITVITIDADGPLLQDGPEALMMLDGRSMSTARRHIASSAAAFATSGGQTHG